MDVIMSIRPEWVNRIFSGGSPLYGKKTFEVRKRAPSQQTPFKVYVYCTAGYGPDLLWGPWIDSQSYCLNKGICGEFTCDGIVDCHTPWSKHTEGTGMTARQLYEYAGESDHLYFMHIKDPILYRKPKTLEEFGLKRPPQSWQYVKEININEDETDQN